VMRIKEVEGDTVRWCIWLMWYIYMQMIQCVYICNTFICTYIHIHNRY